MSISIELGIEPEAAERIQALGRVLLSLGGRVIAGSPHVSLALFAEDAPPPQDILRRFAARTPALELVLTSAAHFESAEGVIYLKPEPCDELRDAHSQLHADLEAQHLCSNPLYAPDLWIPHVTVAVGVRPDGLGRGARLASKQAPGQVTVSCVRSFHYGHSGLLAEHPLVD